MDKDIPGKQDGEKKTCVVILIPEKQASKQSLCKKQKRTLHNDKGAIHQKYITIANMYASNIGAPKYVKQILMDIK